jgi:large subunit ribosomal protein L4
VAQLKKYNIEGKVTGEIAVSDELASFRTSQDLVKNYLVAYRENQRQWSASTLTRAEVKHTTKKPRPQKGTGNARQGSLVTPQFRGGGIAHGPKPKFNQHVSIPRKQKRAVIMHLLAEKIQNGNVKVLDSTAIKEVKTKTVVNFMDQVGINRRVLFLGETTYATVEDDKKVSVASNKHMPFVKSMRNIPKTDFSLVSNVSGYDLAKCQEVIITEAGLAECMEWMS